MKAILEIEMPDSCRQCMLSCEGECQPLVFTGITAWNSKVGRREDCPLKPI